MIFKWIEDDNMTSFLIGLCCFLGGGLVTVVREGAASQKECESISNLINKAVIIEECSKLGDGYADCLELFDRRL